MWTGVEREWVGLRSRRRGRRRRGRRSAWWALWAASERRRSCDGERSASHPSHPARTKRAREQKRLHPDPSPRGKTAAPEEKKEEAEERREGEGKRKEEVMVQRMGPSPRRRRRWWGTKERKARRAVKALGAPLPALAAEQPRARLSPPASAPAALLEAPRRRQPHPSVRLPTAPWPGDVLENESLFAVQSVVMTMSVCRHPMEGGSCAQLEHLWLLLRCSCSPVVDSVIRCCPQLPSRRATTDDRSERRVIGNDC